MATFNMIPAGSRFITDGFGGITVQCIKIKTEVSNLSEPRAENGGNAVILEGDKKGTIVKMPLGSMAIVID